VTATAIATGGPGRWRRTLLLVALAAAVFAFTRGVTIVPDAELAKTDLAGNPVFEPKAFVDAIWSSRVLPMLAAAPDVTVVLQGLEQDADATGAKYGYRPKGGDGPWNFIVKGQGVIRSAETQLRHATITVDDGGHDVTLQIGPVIFGTALRDALPFISFAQVVNQIQFAQISRELNDRASAVSRAAADPAQLKPGAVVAFAGAMAAGSPPQITAMTLHLVGTTP
jgi:predicted lipoprotein